MRHLMADALELGLRLGVGRAREIANRDFVRGYLLEDALLTLRRDDRPQHAVALDQQSEGVLQAARVEVRNVELAVDVRSQGS